MKKKIIPMICAMTLISVITKAQTCLPAFVPDLPLVQSPPAVQSEIDQIYNRAKDTMLSGSAPSANAVNSAIASYNNLNINISGTAITGNPITSFNQVTFINTFSDYLKFNPNDTAIREKVKNTIWWVYQNVCNNTLPPDLGGYTFRHFGRKAAFCLEYLDDADKQRFLYILEKNTGNWNVLWKPQLADGTFDSDVIYTYLDLLIPTLKSFPTQDEQYRYLLTLKRYIARYVSEYTDGTKDGVKPDGCGYHHWNNYEAYMYSYNTVVAAMKILGTTSFQIDAPAYLGFRDAVWHKLLIASDSDMVPLAMTGRSGNWDEINISKNSVKDLAILGGQILGLTTADPVLAGIYNRKYGTEPSFNYSAAAPFETGFYQMNHANASVFRTKNTVVINKGFNNQLWGSEIYPTVNRYGRYQSYGAMPIVYPGDRNANGFNNTKWDWNYNPGATTKVLPWTKLIAGWKRIDEVTSKRFAGSLEFNLKNNGILNKVYGTYGIFAMDFQERKNLGWSGVTAPDTHDPSFTFKKSSFFFDDVIICLASDINNTDSEHSTVTTLYQNSTTPDQVIVDSSPYTLTGTTSGYSAAQDHWVLDNFGTGYYIHAGSGDLKVQRKDQQTPSHNQTDPTILNPAAQAAIGYIDHGAAPSGSGYEYAVVPNTTAEDMQSLATSFQASGTKPYQVLNKTGNSHIIKHKATGIYGLVLFQPDSAVPGNTNIKANDFPCLIMYEPNAANTKMKLSLSNPDLGLPGDRSFEPFQVKTIRITLKGNWKLTAPNSSVTFISSDGNNSIYDFKTYQGLPIEVSFKMNTLSSLSDKKYDIKTKYTQIYPNPAEEVLNIKNNTSKEWKITDALGNVLRSEKNSNPAFSINISGLKSGLYFFSNNEGLSITFIKK
ncbi:T9SS type A sorting domain-containing protein [Chryseobacterium sp. MEBOG06]|uniref:polysaccharide lyase family 8 super-sandwich domain-containing protein n=1 Tax=Chryseobacterium sp. MEBOG06 TaxID=2879938 RepID=UPI001F3E51A8|nr:polysaccharide lyase family 8 super-sandwich domain-containing protein [Chryseobacterium sp. MEBOG06]UKB82817.1 T9SS type A sorting domain-containing protein [Chryseobacterium sp. MEBOG06]